MPRKTKSSSIHPNSLENLEKRGRKSKLEEWGEDGVPYSTNITPTAKTGLLAVAKEAGYKTVPDLLEHIGRKLIEIPPRPEEE